jgi:hypothetical protein
MVTTKKETSIYAKLAEVLGEVHRVPKNGRNDFHKYDYVTESDLADHIRPLLAKNGLALMFGAEEIMDMGTDQKGNRLLAVKCSITLGDSDGNEIRETIWGMGMDKGDKGVYKAMTGAMKYWLYKTFLVSTGDDPEIEESKQPKARPQARTQPKPPSPAKKLAPQKPRAVSPPIPSENAVIIVGAEKQVATGDQMAALRDLHQNYKDSLTPDIYHKIADAGKNGGDPETIQVLIDEAYDEASHARERFAASIIDDAKPGDPITADEIPGFTGEAPPLDPAEKEGLF